METVNCCIFRRIGGSVLDVQKSWGILALMALLLNLVDVQSKPIGTCPFVDSKSNKIHLTDSEDCSVYYTCQSGKSVAHHCRAGLHFSPSLWGCDSPQKADCFLRRPTKLDLMKPACPAVGVCPQRGDPRSFPHAKNCSSYCVCIHGVLVTYSCPEGFWFNRRLNVCDVPLYSECQAHCPAVENCPDSSVESLLAHRFDCSLYCKCLNGTPITATCASGLWFNSRKHKCDPPVVSGCVPEPLQLVNKEGSKADSHRTSTSFSIQQATIILSSSTVDTTTVPYDPKYSTHMSERWITSKLFKLKGTVYGKHRQVRANSPMKKTNAQSESVLIRTSDEALNTLPYTNSAPQLVINPSVDALLPTKFIAPRSISNDVNILPLSPNKPSSTSALNKIMVPLSSSTDSSRTMWVDSSISSIHLPTSTNEKSETIGSLAESLKPTWPLSYYCDTDGACPRTNNSSVAVLFPSMASCEVFCLCKDGVPITMLCPSGRHFSTRLMLCDDPSQAQCVRRTVRKSGCMTYRTHLYLYGILSVIILLVDFPVT